MTRATSLVPYFVDVESDDWLLEPGAARKIAKTMPGDVGAVMPVAAFGQPIDIAAWDEFRSNTGLAVVIDSAAGFDAMGVGDVPTSSVSMRPRCSVPVKAASLPVAMRISYDASRLI